MPFNIVASVSKDGNAAVYYKAQSWIAQLVFHTLNLPTHALLVLLFLQFLAITFLSL